MLEHACSWIVVLTTRMVAANAVVDFEAQEHAREAERQRKLMQHTTRHLSHTLLQHYDVWKELALFSRTASSCLQTCERRRGARSEFELRRSAAMLLQAHVRLHVSKTLGQLREEERVRVEDAGKKRLLNNTPAAKAVGKVTQRFISNWRAISEPYQHLPFHGLPPSTTSFLAAQQQAQENEKKIQEAEAALRMHQLENQRLRLHLEAKNEQTAHSDASMSDGSESSADEVLNGEIDTLETTLKVLCGILSFFLCAFLSFLSLQSPLSLLHLPSLLPLCPLLYASPSTLRFAPQ